MPFVKQEPRPFTGEEIQRITKGQEGVYGLLNGETWIYVGMGDIGQRLLDHMGGDNACITEQRPTHWVAETAIADSRQREKNLIRELKPICNKKAG